MALRLVVLRMTNSDHICGCTGKAVAVGRCRGIRVVSPKSVITDDHRSRVPMKFKSCVF
eukprot:gene5508-biopygen14770